eukprot:36539_1
MHYTSQSVGTCLLIFFIIQSLSVKKEECDYYDILNDETLSQIEEDKYIELYHTLTSDGTDPLTHTRFKAEGLLYFESILYIPSVATKAIYNTKSDIKLYLRGKLVTAEYKDIVPRYLNFVKGIVDVSDVDIHADVDLEDVPTSKLMRIISRKLTRKILDMIRKMAMEDEFNADDDDDEDQQTHTLSVPSDTKYLKFWNEFGKSIKLGLIEDYRNKRRLMGLLRFPTSKSTNVPLLLSQYVSRMTQEQNYIYYILGASIEEVESSPFMETANKWNWEVIYLVDNLDEYLNLHDAQYDDYEFKAIDKYDTEGHGDIDKMKEFMEKKSDEFNNLTIWLKHTYGDRVNKVKVSSNLGDSSMRISTTKYGYSAYMQKLVTSQAFGAVLCEKTSS